LKLTTGAALELPEIQEEEDAPPTFGNRYGVEKA